MTTKEQNWDADVECERYDRFREVMENMAIERIMWMDHMSAREVGDMRDELTRRRKASIEYLRFRWKSMGVGVPKRICWTTS